MVGGNAKGNQAAQQGAQQVLKTGFELIDAGHFGFGLSDPSRRAYATVITVIKKSCKSVEASAKGGHTENAIMPIAEKRGKGNCLASYLEQKYRPAVATASIWTRHCSDEENHTIKTN
ncbi:hypothetical protein JOS77_04775 [Chromobacterium haemolyticum]|nr:hypothetical protein JOS77_04775 [Chromobacterium haemolyticum]